MRIVVVMVEPPLPFGNAAARWFYVLLKGLVERGHAVTAFATCSKPGEIDEVKKLFPSPAYDLRCYPHPLRRGLGAKLETLHRPYSYMFSPQLRHDLESELAKGFDVLHLEQLWTGWIAQAYASRALLNVHYLFSVDMCGFKLPGLRTTRFLARHGEKILLNRFPNICTLTPRLSDYVRKLNPAANIYTVPLGIDTAHYEFAAPEPDRPLTISLIGSFNWFPTASAGIRILKSLWPAIHAACPDVRLQLVGRQAGSVLASFAGKAPAGVSVTENVSDILPYFRDTDILLYPAQQATGMKVKVMESFALGVPVVTTSAGIEGLPAEDGVHAGIAEDDAGLIARTVSLLKDSELRQQRRMAARRLIEDYCSPARTITLFENIYEQMRQGCGCVLTSKAQD